MRPSNATRHRPTYSLLDVIAASASEPMPEASRTHQLTRMYQGLRAIEQEAAPNSDDWRLLADAVNMMETLVDCGIVHDASGLLNDAVEALADAAHHARDGKPLRLSGPGIAAVRAVLEDYSEITAQVSHRTMIRCHRETEKRIREIRSGKRRAGDVEVMEL